MLVMHCALSGVKYIMSVEKDVPLKASLTGTIALVFGSLYEGDRLS